MGGLNGRKCITGVAWTPAEDALLRRWAPRRGGSRRLRALLPARTTCAIEGRIMRLGVQRRKRHWTAADDAYLRREWGDTGLRTLARHLRRCPDAVYRRASDLGLHLGTPQGCESVTAAVARTGYAHPELRRLLAAAGVAVRQVAVARTGRERYVHRYVEPDAVDAAVAAWERSEVLTAAARRRGVARASLIAWLRAAGVVRPTRAVFWRVDSATVDRVVAQHRPAAAVDARRAA